MNSQELLNKLEDLFDLSEGTLDVEMDLNSIPEFDSMAKLSLIVFSDDEFDKKLTAEQLNEFVKVKDIVNFLNL
jgi:acyl carrier protein